MKSSAKRSGKYKAKLRGDTGAAYLPVQKSRFRSAAGEQVRIERAVKTIITAAGVMPGLNHFYMNFGKKIKQLMRKYSGQTLVTEVCAHWGAWVSKGLDTLILDQIICLYMPAMCEAVGVAGGLPWSGQVVVYQAGDDGSYQKGFTLARPIVKGVGSNRFTDNGDGTVTDAATGLMWVRDNEGALPSPWPGSMIWVNALAACEGLTFAGHNDWRMPNIKEFTSIIDFGANNPPLDTVFFVASSANIYWTSTSDHFDPARAVAIYMTSGRSLVAGKGVDLHVRPCRLGLP